MAKRYKVLSEKQAGPVRDRGHNLIAFDLVEIAPVCDLSRISARLACGVPMEILAGVCGR